MCARRRSQFISSLFIQRTRLFFSPSVGSRPSAHNNRKNSNLRLWKTVHCDLNYDCALFTTPKAQRSFEIMSHATFHYTILLLLCSFRVQDARNLLFLSFLSFFLSMRYFLFVCVCVANVNASARLIDKWPVFSLSLRDDDYKLW